MANTNAPFGFRAYGHLDGSAPTMGQDRYWMLSSDSSAVFTGDPVALSSAVYGYVTQYNGSSVTPRVLGIFNGCEYYNPSVGKVVWSSYFPGSVGSSSPVTAYVISDPEMTFLVQASSAGYGSSMIGGNANIVAAQSSLGNTTTGQSVAVLASSLGLVAASSYPFVILDVYSNLAPPGVNGTDNSSAYNIIRVGFNNTFRHAPITGVTT